MTIRPSPDPISSNFPFTFDWRSLKTLVTWLFVAGTYGKQYFRNAGATNGAQIKLKPIAAPPVNVQIQIVDCVNIHRNHQINDRIEVFTYRTNRLEFFHLWIIFSLIVQHLSIQMFFPILLLLMTFFEVIIKYSVCHFKSSCH